jgi:hypothetical protein
MHLIINGYEFGQWLRILLWSHRGGSPLVLSIEGMEEGGTFSLKPQDLSGDGRVDMERTVNDGEEDYKENMYRGILWMKEKYEQYRDLADQRYERLKEQLTRMEKKYEDLLESVRNPNPGLPEQVGAGISGDRLRIKELEEQLATSRLTIEELMTKLRNNSQLLMNIYQELDKSLHFSDTPPQG